MLGEGYGDSLCHISGVSCKKKQRDGLSQMSKQLVVQVFAGEIVAYTHFLQESKWSH